MLFIDRTDAGEQLARSIEPDHFKGKNTIVLGIPRGGIAVGDPVAQKLACPLIPVTLRKLPVPGDDQMGFGAVTLDKNIIVNDEMLRRGYVRSADINPIVDEVYKEVLRRDRVYRGNTPFPSLKGRAIIIVDDGLATGYTMLAAIKFARGKKASKIIAAVPVAHAEAFDRVKKVADTLLCLHVDSGFSFAVAAFYDSFPDMTDTEVLNILKKY